MEQKRKNSPRSSALLVLTAFIWGVAFVAQSEGMNYVGGFTFIGVRYLLGGLTLVPVLFFMKRKESQSRQKEKGQRPGTESAASGAPAGADRQDIQEIRGQGQSGWLSQRTRTGIIGGICCGLCLVTASSLQQFGIAETTVGKAGFITALYIVLVPLLGVFLHRRVGMHVWVSVGLAVVGMYLLCITEGFSMGRGDFLVFLCAIGFTFHIMVIDYFSPRADGVLISCVQFFTAGVVGTVLMFALETPTLDGIWAAWLPIAYAGIMSSGVAYTLQIIAQKNLDPTIACLIMSLESVFSLLAGWVLLGQVLSLREMAGCVLVFVAIILAQLPGKKE